MMTNDMADTAKLSIPIEEAKQWVWMFFLPISMKAGSYFLPYRMEGDSLRTGSHQGSRRGRRSSRSKLGTRKANSIHSTTLSQGGWTPLNRKCSKPDQVELDGLGENRATLGLVDKALSWPQVLLQIGSRDKPLFGEMDDLKASKSPMQIESKTGPRRNDWPPKKNSGFYVSGHPLNPFSPILQQYGLDNTEWSPLCQIEA